MALEGVEDWAESEQKGLFRYVTGSRRPCLLPCQCVRARARVFSLGLFPKIKDKPPRNPRTDSFFFSFPNF